MLRGIDGWSMREFASVWMAWLASTLHALAWAEVPTEWTGRYIYDQYSLTFSNGAVLGLSELGVRDAEITIFPDGTLVSRMIMASGESIDSRASVTDVHLNWDRGSWVEHWPELGYPVRREVERTAKGFEYSARFEDRRDALRFGSMDRGVMRRIAAATATDDGAQGATDLKALPRAPLSEEEARKLGRRMAEEIRAEPAPHQSEEAGTQAFFNESDLADLGCAVAKGRGRFQEMSAPGIPKSRVFTLKDGSGCAVELFSLIQKTDGDAGLWAGLRAQATGDARRRGYQSENRQGRLGERSELRIFTQDGAYRGFWYAIESDNVLYVLRIYSEQIPVTAELETILRRKLALAAD